MSAQAVEILKSKGIKASRLEEGVHEWKRYVEHSNIPHQGDALD
jgi:rhodanese-related sulfurtransferase